MSSPRTVCKDTSIWSRVGRLQFESNVKAVPDTVKIPGATLTGIVKPQEQSNYSLAFESEEQLANDFAFIATARPGPEAIRAATVQAMESPPSFVVTLASNAGVPTDVSSAFKAIVDVLSKCALKEISQKSCEEKLFDIVVNLNVDKLAERLRPRPDDVRPKRTLPRGKPLRSWLTARISGVAGLEGDARIEALEEAIIAYERSPKTQNVHALKSVIRGVHALLQNSQNLEDRLETLRAPAAIIQSRGVHELNQLGRYLTFCRRLSRVSRSHPRFFSDTSVVIVPKYGDIKRLVLPRIKLHVHAEVQLIVHFEQQLRKQGLNEQRPRVIGSSRAACFLCNSFVRAHGQYYLTRTHGVFYHRWAVPDLAGFSQETRSRLAAAIVTVNRDVQAAGAKRPKRLLGRGVWLVQSVVDVSKQMLSSLPSSIISRSAASSARVASQATIKAVSASKDLGPGLVASAQSLLYKSSATVDLPASDCHTLLNESSPSRERAALTIHNLQESKQYDGKSLAGTVQSACQMQRIKIPRGEVVRAVCDKIELFLELYEPCTSEVDDNITAEATLSFCAMKSAEYAVVEIPSLGTRTLSCPDGSRNEINFVLSDNDQSSVHICCRWVGNLT